MPKRGKELSTKVRAQVVAVRNEGYSYRRIASSLKMSLGVVHATLKRATFPA